MYHINNTLFSVFLSFQTFTHVKVTITTEVTVFIYYHDQIEY